MSTVLELPVNQEGKTHGASTRTSAGSTGRTAPANLNEQLAMKQVRSNVSSGTVLINVKMTDARWPASAGWVKMSQNVNGVEIHYNYNTITKATADFKFK